MLVYINGIKSSPDDLSALLYDLQNNKRTLDNITQGNDKINITTSETIKTNLQ